VHLFRPNLGFLTEAQPRLKQARTKGTFWQRRTVNFLGTARTTKQKTSLEKLHIFQIDKFYIQANKTVNLLFTIMYLSRPAV
jgi:hypothetical protein